MEFEKFQKIGRLNRTCVITEKIDGTNAQVCFDDDGNILVGSRSREIWPEGTDGKQKGCDNAGFAKWAYDNKDELFSFLGKGRHFGEWCGGKIQRGYGLADKKFLLFNTNRFGDGRQEIPQSLKDIGLGCVPVLYSGAFDSDTVDTCMFKLKAAGSRLNGFKDPEGVVVFHSATKALFKVTYDYDGCGKGPLRQTDVINEED